MASNFYQPRYWGLDPVFSSRVKLNICDILCLQNYPGFQGVYCILNHPISNVHIVGDVVSVVRKARLISYEVDDGTGVIACCQWRKVEDSDEGIFVPKLGQLVSVFGKVSEFREEKQLTVTSIHLESDPNVEPMFWLEVIQVKKTIYSKPFTLPAGVVDSTPTVESSSTLHEVVQSELTKCLHDHFTSKTFTLLELDSDDSFVSCCLKAIKEKRPDCHEDDVQPIVKLSISKLPLEGVVIPTTKRPGKDTVYKIFSEEKDLVPVVLSYMAKREESAKVSELGLPEDWLVEHVKQVDTFRQFPRAKIIASISSLVEKSLIYPIAPKSYKRVK